MLSLADVRALSFSLSMAREDVGLEDEFELFMQLLGTHFRLLDCSMSLYSMLVAYTTGHREGYRSGNREGHREGHRRPFLVTDGNHSKAGTFNP